MPSINELSHITFSIFNEAGPQGPQGQKGPVGLPGRDGFNGIDGKPGRDAEKLFQGKWNSETIYQSGAIVVSKELTYVSLKENQGKRPPGPNWQRLTGTIGPGGPTGPQGPRGRKAANEDIEVNGAFAPGKVLYFQSNGAPALAQADMLTTALAIGFATGERALRTEGRIIKVGWNLIPGATYWLSADTAGEITAIAPTSPGQLVVVVGKALTSDTLNIEIDEPIQL